MDYKIKLGAVLRFDYTYEKDIIDQVEKLISRHKLGAFISRLIRVAFDNPKLMENSGLTLDEFGVSSERVKYFKEVESEVLKMKLKVDKIYDMTMHMYTMAKFGKRMGLEGKTNNIMRAQFILQRQIEELSRVLGVSNIGHTFESNKIFNVEGRVEDILEYILTSYEDIVEELSTSVNSNGAKVFMEQQEQGDESNREKHNEALENTRIVLEAKNNILKDKGIQPKEYIKYMETNNDYNGDKEGNILEENVDEVVNFGLKADMDTLNTFMGNRG